MNLFFYKKQIVLIGVAIFILGAGTAHSGSMPLGFQKMVSAIGRLSEPVVHTVTCYTDCNQKKGRQGAEAVQQFFREQGNQDAAGIMALLEKPAQGPISEVEQEARKALGCFKRCQLTVIPRFLAQFLATLEEVSVIRAMAVLLGATSQGRAGSQHSLEVSQGNGENTKLFQAVFNKGISRICRRVLRHDRLQQQRFAKNLDLFRQIYFEMYGPVKMAGDYVKTYGMC